MLNVKIIIVYTSKLQKTVNITIVFYKKINILTIEILKFVKMSRFKGNDRQQR
jgi:hypothetical protein